MKYFLEKSDYLFISFYGHDNFYLQNYENSLHPTPFWYNLLNMSDKQYLKPTPNLHPVPQIFDREVEDFWLQYNKISFSVVS